MKKRLAARLDVTSPDFSPLMVILALAAFLFLFILVVAGPKVLFTSPADAATLDQTVSFRLGEADVEEIIKTEVTVRDKEDNMILKVCDEPIECKTSHQVVVTQKAHKLMVKVGAGLTDDNAFLRFLKVKGRDFVLFNTGMESSPIARIWINREEKTLVIDYFYNDGTVSIVKIDTTKKDFPYTVKTFDNIRDEK